MSTIAEELLKLNTAKTNLSTIIESYGGEVPDSFANYGSAISSLINQRDSIPHSSIVSPDSSTIVSANNDGTGTIILLSGDSEIVKTIASTDQIPDISPLATKSAVNTAIGTINTNFTNIQSMLTLKEESNISVRSRASGWAFSPDGETWSNKLRFFHWGNIAYISGAAKCSSALTANSMPSSIGTMSLPSGYTIIGANAGIPGGDYWFWSAASGTMGCKTFVAKSANTSLAIRLIFVLVSIGNKYTKTTIANI